MRLLRRSRAAYLDGKDTVGTVSGVAKGALVPPDTIGLITLAT